MKIILFSSLLATGLAAPTENRLNKSETKYRSSYNRVEFYKDIFAHDISNILQCIQSAIDLFSLYSEKAHNPEDIPNLINLIKAQINRGGDLVSNIKKLSELEESEISLKSIQVNKHIKKAVEHLKNYIKDKDLEIRIQPLANIYHVRANELLLDVYENLLNNAVKYNNKNKIEILIKISLVQIENNHFIKHEIIDNGIGIPDEMKSKVFQRASVGEISVSGMGLGLSLVKKIIETYNGQIWVENKIKEDYSKGSNFIFLIPIA